VSKKSRRHREHAGPKYPRRAKPEGILEGRRLFENSSAKSGYYGLRVDAKTTSKKSRREQDKLEKRDPNPEGSARSREPLASLGPLEVLS
jgi:hypothetical protein